MYESIHGGHRHGGVDEHLAPLRERRVGCDGDALALVALGDQFEQHAGLGLVTPDVAEIVEDKQIEAIELGQLAGQAQVAPRCLQALHELGAAHEQNPPPGIDQGVSEPADQVALTHAR